MEEEVQEAPQTVQKTARPKALAPLRPHDTVSAGSAGSAGTRLDLCFMCALLLYVKKLVRAQYPIPNTQQKINGERLVTMVDGATVRVREIAGPYLGPERELERSARAHTRAISESGARASAWASAKAGVAARVAAANT